MPVVGQTLDLEGFGGEVITHDRQTTDLKRLVDESKAGIVLFTYNRVSTPSCATQACLFRDSYRQLTANGFSIFGLSTDSPASNTRFKEKQGLPYTLLCDSNQALISAIGMKNPPKGTRRGVFVVDKGGKLLAAESGEPAATIELIKRLVKRSETREEDDAFARIVVGFSRDGMFPEEDKVSALHVHSSSLATALIALAAAKTDLESEVQNISSKGASEVDTWIKHAKAIQEDIDISRNLASDITRQSEAGEPVYAAVRDSEKRMEFLAKETAYNNQVRDALRGIKRVTDLLDQAEQAAVERKLLSALHILSDAWDFIYTVPTNARTRAIRLLDDRAFTLRASIHENFNSVWNTLVLVDLETQSITINNEIEVDAMDINSAIITMKAYGELDDRVNQFMNNLENVIIRPRFDLERGTLPSVEIQANTLRTSNTPVENTVKSLLYDLERIIVFLNTHLPREFSRLLSEALMPKLCSHIKETWLDSAVPASLQDMTAFRKAIALVKVFADNLKALQWTGVEELHDWVSNAPRIWLTKRRETALDWTRNQLSLGIGSTRKVDRIETQTLSRNEGRHIASNENGNENDWDAAWSDEDENGKSASRPKSKSGDRASNNSVDSWQESGTFEGNEDDGSADAWGWGDDEAGESENAAAEHEIPQESTKGPVHGRATDAVREVTLTERYTISSIPEPIYNTIKSIIEDGATLSKEINEHNPVAAAAGGLLALPTLILAMYRAVSPYYYALNPGGYMHLYNDAMWLAEQLRDFGKNWAMRDDMNEGAIGKARLHSEIEVLLKFGKRAYGTEMNTQRTILNDLLGGTQNFLQQDAQSSADDEVAIDSIVSHIKAVSGEWKQILSKSAWAQATGSLLSAVAKKIILDVEDLTSLGADEAYRVANLISKIVKLDDLFLPENKDQPQIPVTSQYAPNWLKLHFLSEVLQSDLKDVKYLWFESDLSLYFNVEEVVDLIELSFENNFRTREAIASIRENPKPRGVDVEDL